MRHRKSGRKLGRNSAHRRALFRNMTASLLAHGRIETTLAKAKELRRWVEPVITKAIAVRALTPRGADKARGEKRERALQLRRLIASQLPKAATLPSEEGDRLFSRRDLVGYLVDDIAPRYAGRPGGYTRIRRLGLRKGDNAPVVLIELVPSEPQAEAKEPKAAAGKKRSGFFRRGKAEAAAEDEARADHKSDK